jgi:hypothetical protein
MWTKKSNKGHQEWEKAYVKAGNTFKEIESVNENMCCFQSY